MHAYLTSMRFCISTAALPPGLRLMPFWLTLPFILEFTALFRGEVLVLPVCLVFGFANFDFASNPYGSRLSQLQLYSLRAKDKGSHLQVDCSHSLLTIEPFKKSICSVVISLDSKSTTKRRKEYQRHDTG